MNDLNYQVNETDVIAIAIAVYEAFDCHKLKPLPADHSGVDLGEIFYRECSCIANNGETMMNKKDFIKTVLPLISSGGVRWVSVDERLPDAHAKCLLNIINPSNILMGYINTKGKWVIYFADGASKNDKSEPEEITHWASLPDLPQR